MARIIVFASGKGGVGKSSLCVGTGKALASVGMKVLLVDTDVGLRSLDLLAGGAETLLFDWGDIILNRCDPKAAVCVAGQLNLLSCPHEYNEAFTAEAMKKVIDNFSTEYDCILIDAPAGIGNGLKLACAAAEFGIVIATPDAVCVRSACRAAEVMAECGVSESRLIVNRFRKKAVLKKQLLNIDSVIDDTSVQLIGVVPEDPAIGFGSIYGKGQLSTGAFTRIAKRITGKAVPLFGKG